MIWRAVLNLSFLWIHVIAESHLLTWFPTHEGLASHMRQLEEIWRNTGPRISKESQGRRIIIAPSDSHFYPDVLSVNYCEIFKFPPRIACETKLNRSSLALHITQRNAPCTISGGELAGWFGWPSECPSIYKPHVDWARVICLGGFIKDTAKHGGGQSDSRLPWSFQPKYPDLARSLMRISGALPTDSNEFFVAHWRRGNQLTNRCVGLHGVDKSVNCGGPVEFIAEIARLRQLHWPNYEHWSVYVATNEELPEHIHALAQAGFKLFSNLTVHTSATGQQIQNLTSLDRFGIELVIMCEARVLLQWGNSTSHRLVEGCRGGDATKATLVNGAPPRPLSRPAHRSGG